MKALNLYAGLGGNRELWPEEVEVTAIELDRKIAKRYKERFPEDEVIITDAHKFLLECYSEYNFIWSSPPCQSHSGTNNFLHAQGIKRFPDLKLYEEVIFLKRWCRERWVVENVRPYYEPLIYPQFAGRHVFWANFLITPLKVKCDIGTMNREASKLAQSKAKRDQLERNCVNPRVGLHVFNCAFKVEQKTLID